MKESYITVVGFLNKQSVEVQNDELFIDIRMTSDMRLNFDRELSPVVLNDISTKSVIKAIVKGKVIETFQTINRVSKKHRVLEVESYNVM